MKQQSSQELKAAWYDRQALIEQHNMEINRLKREQENINGAIAAAIREEQEEIKNTAIKDVQKKLEDIPEEEMTNKKTNGVKKGDTEGVNPLYKK